MKYQDFYTLFSPQKFFSVNEIRLREPNFTVKNLQNRIKVGYICSIIKGRYTFTQISLDESTMATIATHIYTPSYISMETALRYYDLIPEGVYMQTCISTKKTQTLKTSFGICKYNHLHPKHFRGYTLVKNTRGTIYKMAEPEKVICDFFYLKPHIYTLSDFEQLRIESRQRAEIIDEEKLIVYAQRFGQKRLLNTIHDFISYIHTHD